MYHRNYTTYLHKELDFLKLLVSRFHEQEQLNDLELGVALQKTQEIYERFLKIKLQTDSDKQICDSQISEKPICDSAICDKTAIDDVAMSEIGNRTTVNREKASILAEKISPSDFQPINETLAQQKSGNDLSSKLQTAPLSSIISGIGLNDKFLYTRELFKGDSELYNNVVKYLDTAESLEEALIFIQRNFDWDEKSETVQKFVGLVHRKHVS